MAALIVRQKLLKDKHALEEQPKRKKGQLELEANIFATMAKMRVLGASKGSGIHVHSSKASDGMKSYFEHGQQEKKTLTVKADPFVPRLQAMHPPRQIPPNHRVINPQIQVLCLLAPIGQF